MRTILNRVETPKYAKLRYNAVQPSIKAEELNAVLRNSAQGMLERIGPDDSVAIAVGSREIANLPVIVRALGNMLAERGARTFIVPAMGSHGGATAEGQEAVLKKLGIDAEHVGMPVRATMDVVDIGRSSTGMEVYADRLAWEAKWVIPVARIKPHTDFRGRVESGIAKMLTIGLGKQAGAERCHCLGWERMSENIAAAAEVWLREKVAFAVGIVENGWHETAICEAIPAGRVLDREAELLQIARDMLLRIPFEKVEVLILEQMGKDISGSGLDPNVTGRSSILGRSGPYVDSIAVFDLTEASHGNATGVGKADVISERLFQKIDRAAMYLNGLTGQDMRGMQISVVMPNDDMAYRAALKACWGVVWKDAPRIVWMKDTLHVQEFYISENLVTEAEQNAMLTLSEERFVPAFDGDGNFSEMKSVK